MLACLLVAFLACFLVQCSRCERESAPEPAASVRELPPPVAPRGLIAELVVPRPDQLWGVTRELAAAYAPVLPHEGALALTHGLGLPLTVAGLFELESPLVGVLTLDASDHVVPTLAIQVRSGRELVALLTTGAEPPFLARVSDADVTGLEPKTPNPSYHLAVYRNHLVVSSALEQTLASARFLVEMARKRPRPEAPLALNAIAITARQPELRSRLAPLLRSKWRAYQAELRESEAAARRERGRPPDFADPEAVLGLLDAGVEALIGVVTTSKELTLGARFLGSDLMLSLDVLPEATGAAKDFVRTAAVGSPEPLRSLPEDTAIALLSRSVSAERARSAHDVAVWLERIFGARLREPERAQVQGLLAHFARGRGDDTTVALSLGSSPAVLVRGALGDAAELDAALEALPGLVKIEAIAQPLTHFLGPLRSTPVRTTLAGRAVRGHAFSFAPKGSLHELAPAGLSVFWSATEGAYQIALGGPQALAHWEPSAPRPLGELSGVSALLERIGPASFVALARPVPLGLLPEPPRTEREPLISISAGSRGELGFVNTNIPSAVLGYYARPGDP